MGYTPEMDTTYFVITDLSPNDTSQRILNSLVQIDKVEVIVFVKDFELLQTMRRNCPSALYLLLDQTKNEEVTKEFLRNLPMMNCFINYTGESFSKMLKEIPEIKISRETIYNPDTLTANKISADLEFTDNNEALLINVSSQATLRKRDEEGQLWDMLFSPRLTTEPTPSSSKDDYAMPPYVRFRPGSKATSPTTSEKERLLPVTQRQEETEQGFFRCLFCFCYTFCCSSEKELLKFSSPGQIRVYVRMAHMIDLREQIEDLMKAADAEWNTIVQDIKEKEDLKLRMLVQHVQKKIELEEIELNAKKDAENKATEANLSNVLSEEQIERIRKSRDRQVNKKLKWTTDVRFLEGSQQITKGAQIHRELRKDKHHCDVVLRQNKIMKTLNLSFKARYEHLMYSNFGPFLNKSD